MKIKDVKIEKLDYFGRGISRVDNKVIFVDKALPNELVDVEVLKDKKKYKLARLDKLKEESIYRRNLCPYAFSCGGCDIVNLNYDKQLEYKYEKVKEIIKRNFSYDIKVNDIIYSKELSYRNKILLHISSSKLGFYESGSNNIVEIDECKIVNDKVNSLIKLIKLFIIDNRKLNSVIIRITSTDEVMLIFSGIVDETALKNYFSFVECLVLNGKSIKGRCINERLGNKSFSIYPNSFFQVNIFNTINLYNEVIRMTYGKRYKSILDLYCGTGTIGIFLSDIAESVIGIEVIEDAVKSALENAKQNKANNIEFVCGKVENYIEKFTNIDLIVVDPPRAGLDKKTIENIKRINADEVIYVSCDIMTLVRDLKELESIYVVKEITPVDMFPNTQHVECVSLLQKKTIEE